MFLPSVFEEKESFGSDVADVIAQRVNDACSKKPLESKFKELQDKYKTPQNCKFLCVPNAPINVNPVGGGGGECGQGVGI